MFRTRISKLTPFILFISSVGFLQRNITAFHFPTNRSMLSKSNIHTIADGIRYGASFIALGAANTGSSRGVTAADVLADPQWPEEWPFKTEDFKRQDESSDNSFYSQPRFVYHIDDNAVAALTTYYKSVFFDGASVLDVCSSWVSHFPKDIKLGRTAGTGMNEAELKRNDQLTEYSVKDLNVDPSLDYEDNSFDFVTCVVSVDYLTRPLEVFTEIRRVLKPNGMAIISQSNRCFPTKAINIWLNTNDLQHMFIIGAYFHYAGGFQKAEAIDVSPNSFPFGSDPMYIIQAKKEQK